MDNLSTQEKRSESGWYLPLDLGKLITGSFNIYREHFGPLLLMVLVLQLPPILVVLLTYLAGSGSSVAYGGLLLLVYALGHSVLILVAGTSMGAARKIIESKRATAVSLWLRRVAGGVIVLVGAYFVYRALAG